MKHWICSLKAVSGKHSSNKFNGAIVPVMIFEKTKALSIRYTCTQHGCERKEKEEQCYPAKGQTVRKVLLLIYMG
jgi:hypothetical protein